MAEGTRTYPASETAQGKPLFVPRVSAFEAVVRNWPLALLPVVLLVGAGLVLGLQRDPVYKADTRMAVGGIDVTQPGALSGFAIAGESLATTYSRTVDAEAVVVPAARETGLSPQAVRSRVTATPIPQSPVFRITAEGPNAEEAEQLANAVATSLQGYVANLSRPRERSDRLFDQYRVAARDYNQVFEAKEEAEERFADDDSATNLGRMTQLRGEANAARLRLQGLEENYLKSINAQSSSPGIDQLSKAVGADSDRNSKLQLYLFIGLLGGLLSGIALATLRANRLLRRRLTA